MYLYFSCHMHIVQIYAKTTKMDEKKHTAGKSHDLNYLQTSYIKKHFDSKDGTLIYIYESRF